MQEHMRGASRRMSFNDAPTCNHGNPAFVQRRRKDGTLYAVPMIVDMCGRPAVVTFTRDGNIQRRCTSHMR